MNKLLPHTYSTVVFHFQSKNVHINIQFGFGFLLDFDFFRVSAAPCFFSLFGMLCIAARLIHQSSAFVSYFSVVVELAQIETRHRRRQSVIRTI